MKTNEEKDIEILLNKADILINNTITKVNQELINLYWNIGKMISEYKKENNSKYGDKVVKIFSEKLNKIYGAGFDRRNIFRSVKFYQIFQKSSLAIQFITKKNSKIEIVAPEPLFENITWSHIRELLIFNDIKIIDFYLNQIVNKSLSKRELIFQLKSKSYERIIANQKENIKHEIETTLKDPIILNLKNKNRTERELEDEIVNNVLSFMKEIGNNVMFYGRQYKINIKGLIYKVDLVFYDNKINSYILIDLKINKVANKDIFQMQMYIDHFNKYMITEGINKTIGIILCETKDIRVIADENIYQIKYLNELPKEEELLKIINDNKVILLKTDRVFVSE